MNTFLKQWLRGIKKIVKWIIVIAYAVWAGLGLSYLLLLPMGGSAIGGIWMDVFWSITGISTIITLPYIMGAPND